MNDLISRDDVYIALNRRARNMFSLKPDYEYYLGALHDVADDVKQIPTADNQATWVKHTVTEKDFTAYYYTCSNCDRRPMNGMIRVKEMLTEYCPHCGCKMSIEEGDSPC